MAHKKVVIFASGEGTGFENLVQASRTGLVQFEIAGLVCDTDTCDAQRRAKVLGVRSRHLPRAKNTPEAHEHVVRELGGKNCFVMLSGCRWNVPMKATPADEAAGLDPRFVVNIHPALLSAKRPDGKLRFGGRGMYGDAVHKAVFASWKNGRWPHSFSGVSMHFVTREFDTGPIIFEQRFPLLYDSWEPIRVHANRLEHYVQPRILEQVVSGAIYWDGIDPSTLVVPDEYRCFLP